MNIVRVGIVGLGTVSFEHIEKLRGLPGTAIVGVCDREPSVAQAVSERFCVGPAYTEFDRLLAEGRPHAVHVLTPPQSHAELVLQALGAGCHVLVEKPIAPTWDDYVSMRDAALRRGLLLVENYNWRFNRVVREALAMARAGRIGKVVDLDVQWTGVRGDPGVPGLSHFSHALPGGSLQNLVTHPVSLIIAFGGSCRAMRVLRQTFEPGAATADELRALLAGPQIAGVLCVSGHAKPAGFVLRVRGACGAITADLYNDRISIAGQGLGAAKFLDGVRQGLGQLSGTGSLLVRTLSSQVDQFEGLGVLMRGFYDSVSSGAAPPVSIREMDEVNRVVAALFAPEHQL